MFWTPLLKKCTNSNLRQKYRLPFVASTLLILFNFDKCYYNFKYLFQTVTTET